MHNWPEIDSLNFFKELFNSLRFVNSLAFEHLASQVFAFSNQVFFFPSIIKYLLKIHYVPSIVPDLGEVIVKNHIRFPFVTEFKF